MHNRWFFFIIVIRQPILLLFDIPPLFVITHLSISASTKLIKSPLFLFPLRMSEKGVAYSDEEWYTNRKE